MAKPKLFSESVTNLLIEVVEAILNNDIGVITHLRVSVYRY